MFTPERITVSAELEITVSMLIQVDKLVQLLESPVFTYLRLQLLEPEKYPYLYKCLYGTQVRLLPQKVQNSSNNSNEPLKHRIKTKKTLSNFKNYYSTLKWFSQDMNVNEDKGTWSVNVIYLSFASHPWNHRLENSQATISFQQRQQRS
ncbi:hypothetical protein DFQ28_006316 [Apophysomyces sp. BC1034]|nr:hypothetical protein DFQ28_006316 [Apophysomyces sp. BC1034]